MNLRIFAALSSVVCLLLLPLPSSGTSPPKIPGKTYAQALDGCGQLVPEASLTPRQIAEVAAFVAKQYWIGDCRHGLTDGFGYWLDPSQTLMGARDAFMQLGTQQFSRASISPSAGVWEYGGGAQIGVTLFNESKTAFNVASVPVHWDIRDPFKPFYTSNNGSGLDDFNFTWMKNVYNEDKSKLLSPETIIISVGARSCLIAGKKMPGCKAVFSEYDVYGVMINDSSGNEGSVEKFTLCPNPRTTDGCDALWRQIAGPYIERIVAHIKDTETVMAAEHQAYARDRSAAESALPEAWKSYWKSHPMDRSAVVKAQQCRDASDFAPSSLANAFYIQQKYSTPPCDSAITASYAVAQAKNFVAYDSKGKDQEAAIQEGYAQAKARRDAANAEAWAGFFNTTSAMLNTQIQIQQQRIDNTNAQIAASNRQQKSAPAYQSYGQPLSSSAGQQSYAADKVQTRGIHKPEWDAQQCVRIIQMPQGDSALTGTGSQKFFNSCDKAVEVFWCQVGGECESGRGNTWKIHPQSTWPLSAGQYYYGACISGSSGGFVKDSYGKVTGRYACTGP